MSTYLCRGTHKTLGDSFRHVRSVHATLYGFLTALCITLSSPWSVHKKARQWTRMKTIPQVQKNLRKNIIIILLKQGIICLPSITFNTVNILSKFRSSLSIMICVQSTLVSELMRYRDKIEYVQNLNLTQIFII